jgi:hypothetical protein
VVAELEVHHDASTGRFVGEEGDDARQRRGRGHDAGRFEVVGAHRAEEATGVEAGGAAASEEHAPDYPQGL